MSSPTWPCLRPTCRRSCRAWWWQDADRPDNPSGSGGGDADRRSGRLRINGIPVNRSRAHCRLPIMKSTGSVNSGEHPGAEILATPYLAVLAERRRARNYSSSRPATPVPLVANNAQALRSPSRTAPCRRRSRIAEDRASTPMQQRLRRSASTHQQATAFERDRLGDFDAARSAIFWTNSSRRADSERMSTRGSCTPLSAR